MVDCSDDSCFGCSCCVVDVQALRIIEAQVYSAIAKMNVNLRDFDLLFILFAVKYVFTNNLFYCLYLITITPTVFYFPGFTTLIFSCFFERWWFIIVGAKF